MHEIFPVVAGVLVGLIALRAASMKVRAVVIAILSVLFGVTASAISGELAITWEFILVDIPLVVISALAAIFVVHRVFSFRVAHR